ncbi:MAG: hypothetical protein M1527_05600 [Gammaproteobacteria bacterium]|nr:hypothetical protein [Gammaproteobacteria bacterium]
MIEIRKTGVFAQWLDDLRDNQARARAGGDKSTQAKDIKTALRLARNLSE